MKDITLLIAHPDDEALFLWPFLDRVKRIVCASSDLNNIARQFCRERRYSLEEVGNLLGASVACFDYDSEFYRLPTRTGDLKRAADDIIAAIGHPGVLATHNAWGEYGNLDHIICHHVARTVQARTGCQLLVTDIATEINWLPVTAWQQSEETIPDWDRDLKGTDAYGGPKTFELDRPLFDRIKSIYDERGCWTWAWEPVETCRVFSL